VVVPIIAQAIHGHEDGSIAFSDGGEILSLKAEALIALG
jgi:hypothetical protein